MNAIQEAKELYKKHNLSFERDLCFYLQHGVVISRPDRFLMAKLINSSLGNDDQWNPLNPDCWLVQCAVGRGSLEWFLLQAPLRMPKSAFRRYKDRQNKLKVYNTNTFERLVS